MAGDRDEEAGARVPQGGVLDENAKKLQTQILELKTRVGRAIGKHGSVGNAVQNTHKVDVKYFADGTRRGVVYVTSDTRDLKACVAGIKRIQEVARASVPIGTLRLDHIERCFEGM